MSKQFTVDVKKAKGLTYMQAVRVFAASPKLHRPTTQRGRKDAALQARIFAGVCHDWNKGTKGRNKQDNILFYAGVTGKSKMNTVDRLKMRMLHMLNSRESLGDSFDTPSMDSPPAIPKYGKDEPVHVITFSGGMKKMPDLFDLSLNNLMRILRERENISMKTLSERCGVSAPGIQSIESGRALPRIATVAKIADHLNLSDREFDLLAYRLAQQTPDHRFDEKAAKERKEDRRMKAHVEYLKRKDRKSTKVITLEDSLDVQLELSGDDDESETSLKMAGHPAYNNKKLTPDNNEDSISVRPGAGRSRGSGRRRHRKEEAPPQDQGRTPEGS